MTDHGFGRVEIHSETTPSPQIIAEIARARIRASDIRREYCFGRITLEEAKILDRQGEHAASCRKYGSAARRFQKILNIIEHESSFANATIAKDRQELMPLIYLCKAWQMMTRAEAEASGIMLGSFSTFRQS